MNRPQGARTAYSPSTVLSKTISRLDVCSGMVIVYVMRSAVTILFLVLSAVFLTTGCAFPEASHGWIGDERFTADERAAILEGASYVASVTGTEPIAISWEKLPVMGREHTIRKTDLPQGTGGLGGENSHVDLDPWQCTEGRLGPAAAHELGHVLGLGHLPEGTKGLMGTIILRQYEWTTDDQALCVKDGVCQ